jgi:integrase
MSHFIEKREGKRRTTYRAQVIIKRDGRIVHRESQSFAARRDASAWGAQRDKQLQKALDDPEAWQALTQTQPSHTLAELIKRYQRDYSASYGRTVGMDLELLARAELAEMPVEKITSADIVAHIKLRADGVKNPDGQTYKVAPVSPATALNDLIRLRTVFEAAWASWNIETPRDELTKARIECRKRRLVGKSKERERVITDDELERLCAYFDQSTRQQIPMSDIVRFAVQSARRQDEITQLRWADNDGDKLTGIVPRLKDPSGARLNIVFRYTQEAWAIVQRQPRTHDRIFPYESRSIGAAFTRACKVLGIRDLRFHDLRHSAVTRLFQRGYQVHEVPAFSLHRSWSTLRRYTNITPDQVALR